MTGATQEELAALIARGERAQHAAGPAGDA
jgi:hypothetical protein